MRFSLSILLVIVSLAAIQAASPALVLGSDPNHSKSQYREVGDTIFLGNDWYLKNPLPGKRVLQADSMPFVTTDSSADSAISWNPGEVPVAGDKNTSLPESEMKGNYVYTSWFSSLLGSYQVFSKFSTNFGYNWGDSSVLSPLGTSNYDYSAIDGSDSLIYVVWIGGTWYATYFRKTVIGSGVWSPTTTVTEYIEGGGPFTGRPDITTNGSALFLTYEASDHTGFNQRFKRSTDYGDSWSSESVVGGVATGRGAEITYGDGVLHVIRGGGGIEEVRYNKSTDGGQSWGSQALLSDDDEIPSQWPSITADPFGNVYATWFDYKNSPNCCTGYLFYRRSTDHGESWEPVRYLSPLPNTSWSEIRADSSTVYVIWNTGTGAEKSFVHFRMSTDYGIDWSEDLTLNDSLTDAIEPKIDIDAGYISVIWDAVRSGEYIALAHKLGGRYLSGDADGNGSVNISDAVRLISYIFTGGTPPVIYQSGDANCSGNINISDAVYLIVYIFAGGAAPCQ